MNIQMGLLLMLFFFPLKNLELDTKKSGMIVYIVFVHFLVYRAIIISHFKLWNVDVEEPAIIQYYV